MHRILFICYGNICRSPMAEFIMKDLVEKHNLSHKFHIESRGTSTEELGNPVYPPARAELAKHGISCKGKVSIQFTADDYDDYDLLIVMDSLNFKTVHRIIGEDSHDKVRKIMDYTEQGGDVSDPWYTRRFETTYHDLLAGCEGLLAQLTEG